MTPDCLTIVIDARHHKSGKLRYIAALLADYPGDVPVSAQILSRHGVHTLTFADAVEPSKELYDEVRRLGAVAVPGEVPLPAERP